MKYIYIFLAALVLSAQSIFAQGNTSCADDQSNDISGICALCGVTNPEQAVDGNPGTYSTLQTTLGLLGTEVSQTLIFSETGSASDIISLVVEDPSGLLNLTLGGNLQVESYLGSAANGDAVTVTSGTAGVITGTSKYRIEFPAGADFDRVKITLGSGVLGADLSSIRVYSACFTENEFPPVCVRPASQNDGSGGFLCALCGVSNPLRAIDGDESTYSQINVGVGVGANAHQTFNFNEASCVGEELKMIIENPGGLISAALLGNVSVTLRDNANNVLENVAVNFNNLELLSGGSKYIYRFTPSVSYERVRVQLDGGLVGVLSGLRIYEVCKNRIAPPSPLRDTVLACSGSSIDLSAVSAPGTTIKWYNASSGGTLLHSGEIFSTPSLTSNTTYYLQTEVDSSGCSSPSRSAVYVEIVPDAPAPVLTQNEYTVYEGDGVTINPGPTNVDFNFYSDRNGATTLHTGSAFRIDNIFTDTTIYVQSNLDGCLSDLDSVMINIVSRPNPDDTITAISYCADTTETGVTGVCASCGVFNAENAIDGNDNTYSTLQTTLGLLGAGVYQDLIFDTPGKSGDIVTVVVEDPSGLLSATLGSNMSVATYQGSASNGDEMTVTTGVLSAVAGSNKFIIEFTAGSDFDRVRINLASGVLGVDVSSIRVYSVCYRNDHYEPICDIPVNQSYDINGLLCVLCGVEDGINAIDGDEDTYSQLNVNVGLAASVSQTFTYSEASCAGEELKLMLENPGGLLDVALLGSVDVELLDASDNVVATEDMGISNLTLLNGSTSKYLYRFAPSVSFQKLRIRLNGGLVGALASLRIYEVCRNQTAPPLPVRDTVLVCDGNSTTLHAQSAAYTSISWWDAETGGTELGTGKFFQTPVLTANTTYYLQASVDTSGCISPIRSAIYVEVVPEAPAPVLTTRQQTVYTGDDVQINPGPSNVDFNFYSDRDGTNILATGTTYDIDSITSSTKIYVQTNLSGCLSDEIDSVVINVINQPDPNPGDTTSTISACADSTFSNITGVCAVCGVFDEGNAVDGNDNTYSTLRTTLGLLGTEVSQTLMFSDTGETGYIISLVVEDPASALALSLGGNLKLETFLGNVSNNDQFTVTSGIVGALGGSSSKYVIEFTANADFDRVEVSLASGVLGVDLSSLRIYSACFRNDLFEPVCLSPGATMEIVNACLGCDVDDETNAIDGNENTYSQLNVLLSVTGYIGQEFTFNEESCAGEEIKLILENPGGLLSVSLLGNVELIFKDASDNVIGSPTSIPFANLQLISGSQKYLYKFVPSFSFRKMEVRLNGGLLSALSGLRIYEVCKNTVAPPAPFSDTVNVCDGNSITLQAASPAGTTISWWDAPTGGSQLATGPDFTTPVITSDVTYFLESTVDSSGCTSAVRNPVFLQVQPGAPDPVITMDSLGVCTGDSVVITPGPAGSVFNFYGDREGIDLLAAGEASYTVDSAVGGSFIYIRTNLAGCLSDVTDSVFIDADGNPSPPALSADTVFVCTGGDVEIDIPNPEAGFTYEWYDTISGGTSLFTGESYTVSSVMDTMVLYIASNRGTCASSSRTEVVVIPVTSPEIDITSGDTAIVCNGSDAVITASSRMTDSIVWYDASTGGNIIGGGSPFTYATNIDDTVSIFAAAYLEAGDCESADRAEIVIITGDVLDIDVASDSVIICDGDTATLTGISTSSGVTYTWYDAASGGNVLHTGEEYEFTPSTTTTVYLEANTSSCTNTNRIPATVYLIDTLAMPVVSDTTICAGTTAELYAGKNIEEGIVEWYDAPSGGSLVAVGDTITTSVLTSSTTYYLSLNLGAICNDLPRVPLNVNVLTRPLPTDIMVSDTTICIGDSVVLTATSSDPAHTFRWYDAAVGGNLLASGATFQTPALNATTQYFIEATVGQNCNSASRARVTVTPVSQPDINLITDSLVACSGDMVNLLATTNSSSATIRWYDAAAGGNLLFTGGSYEVQVNADTLTLYVEAAIGGCTSGAREEARVYNLSNLAMPVVSDTTICTGESVSLTAMSNLPGATPRWWDAATGGNLLATASTYNTPNLTSTTTYYVDLDLGASVCPDLSRTPVTVTVEDRLVRPVVTCEIVTDNSITFSWTPVAGADGYEVSLDSGNTFMPANTPPASHEVTGLVVGESRTIIVRAVGSVSCQTSEESFPVTCTTTDCPDITVNYSDELTICEGESADIYLSNISIPDYGVIFEGNSSQDTMFTVSPTEDTTYSIVIFNSGISGCDSLTIEIDVNVNPRPRANFEIIRMDSNYTGTFINSFRFIPDAPGAVSWFWDFGDGNTSILNSPEHDYMNEGKYDVSLTVTNSYGCSDSITIDEAAWVRMVPDFFIPNTFTPDGDGFNDKFNVLGDNIKLIEMRIFNSFGNLVFSTTNLSDGWDGTYRGSLQPSGVYSYTVIVSKPNGNRVSRNGTITLIR